MKPKVKDIILKCEQELKEEGCRGFVLLVDDNVNVLQVTYGSPTSIFGMLENAKLHTRIAVIRSAQEQGEPTND